MKLAMVIFIFVANIADALLTNFGIRSDRMTEGNPIMGWLYAQSPTVFVIVKILLPLLLVFLFLFFIPKKPSVMLRGLLIAASCIYIYIMALHGVWLTNMI